MAAIPKSAEPDQDEAPSIFFLSQHDMLGVNKRVDYAARGDEWICCTDAS